MYTLISNLNQQNQSPYEKVMAKLQKLYKSVYTYTHDDIEKGEKIQTIYFLIKSLCDVAFFVYFNIQFESTKSESV